MLNNSMMIMKQTFCMINMFQTNIIPLIKALTGSSILKNNTFA